MRSDFKSSVRLTFALVCLAFASSGRAEVETFTRSIFFPIGPSAFCMYDPSGNRSLFLRDPDCPNRLIGDGKWLGETDGNRVLMRKVEGGDEFPCGLLFVHGRLRRMLLGGRERLVETDSERLPIRSTHDWWTNRMTVLETDRLADIWGKSERLRLWYRNPNDAGIFLAEILILVAAYMLSLKWHCVATATGTALLFALSAFALIATGSRGALVSAACGLLALALARIRTLLHWRTVVSGFCFLMFMVAAVWMSPYRDRMTSHLLERDTDKSNIQRVEILKSAPVMFAQAPFGWGFGHSGKAYVDWYQQRNDFVYDDLISSHLTFLVEGGWFFSVVYIFFWLFAWGMSFLRAWRGGSPLAVGTLTVLGIGGFFNPCLKIVSLCVLPVVSLLFSTPIGLFLRWRAVAVCAATSLLLSITATAGFVFLGKRMTCGVSLWNHGGVVSIGGSLPTVCVVDDGYAMNGGFWWKQGKFVRHWFERTPSVACGFTRHLKNVPKSVRRVVLIGSQSDVFLKAWREGHLKERSWKELVFLSPSFRVADVSAELLKQYDVSGFRGEFLSETDDSAPQDWLKSVRGTALYLPKWLSYATEVKK